MCFHTERLLSLLNKLLVCLPLLSRAPLAPSDRSPRRSSRRLAGWSLVLLDYGEENETRLRNQFPDAHVYTGDLTNADTAQSVFDNAQQDARGLDAVLSIAGGFSMQPATEATQQDADKMMALNFQTLFQTARAAIPHLLEKEQAFFLGVSAPAAEDGGAGAALYAASKGAVAAYVKSLDAEYADDGLRASVLYPMGVVDTPDNREAMPDADPNTWVAPRELAESMLYLAHRSHRGHVKTLKVHASMS